MWYMTGVALFVVGAVCVMVAGALVLDITLTNKRRGLRRSEGVGGWAAIGLVGFAVAVVGFVLASMAA
jgi:drug/metabolite transporter (DMT)-like permease